MLGELITNARSCRKCNGYCSSRIAGALGNLEVLLSPDSFAGATPADRAELVSRLWAAHAAAAPEWRPLIAATLRLAVHLKPP